MTLQGSNDTLEGVFSGWDGAAGLQRVASRDLFIDLGAGYTQVFSLCQFSELNTDCCRIYCMLVRCQYKGLINSTINHHKTMKLSKERNKKEKQRLYTEVEDGICYL